MQQIPKALPIFIYSGDKDPVGASGKGVERLYRAYRKAGLQDVSMTLYPGGRHEMHNEINRNEVMMNVVKWLDNIVHR